MDFAGAVQDHMALFNACVRSGDWTPFVATFTEDARMTVVNAPAGTLMGRDAIGAMYTHRPPTETMRLLEVDTVDEGTAAVRFAWDSGRESSMVVRWRGDRVCGVELTL